MSSGQSDESPRAFFSRMGNALLRILALGVFGLAHWLLEKGLHLTIPPNMTGAESLLLDISFVAFAAVYVYLLWDFIKVFIPRLHVTNYPPPEKKDATQ